MVESSLMKNRLHNFISVKPTLYIFNVIYQKIRETSSKKIGYKDDILSSQ